MKNNSKNTKKNFLSKAIWVVLFFFIYRYAGFPVSDSGPKDAGDVPLFQGVPYVKEAWEVIERRYFEDITSEKSQEISEGAIAGMMASFDRYSRFVPPMKSQIEWENTEGSFGGIGVTIAPYGKFLQVVSVVKDGPAYKSKVKNGDIIISADGISFESLGYEESVSLVRGPIGESVQLEIIDSTTAETLEVSIKREVVVVPSIGNVEKVNEKTYLIQVLQFNKNTPTLLRQEIQNLINENVENLILDLRGNPGGELYSCLEIVDMFLEEGVIVKIKFRDEEKVFSAKPGDIAEDLNLVVIVDEYSASASEIFAGAMQDHQRALVIGNTTFGKGLVQHGETLENGGSIIITTAVYLTPNGNQVNGNGIVPDLKIETSTDEDILALLEKVEELQNEISILRSSIRDRIGDLMLEKAIGEIGK